MVESSSSNAMNTSKKYRLEEEENEQRFTLPAGKQEQDSSNQQIVETLTDRISELPDSILSRILSLLPTTEEAIGTSILSKRFRYQWTSVDTLIFGHRYWMHPLYEFSILVDRTLSQCSKANSKLKKFEIRLVFNESIVSQLIKWILYALDRNVEELVLDMTSLSGLFTMPQHLFTMSSLTDLRLSSSLLKPKGQISWKRLTRLRLSWIDLSYELIANMLDGSPCLENLELCHCRGITRLDITSMSLKELVLDQFSGREDTLEINAPYICSLKIKMRLHKPIILFGDVSSLVEANLDFDEDMIISELIERLQHVNKLTYLRL